MFYFFSKLDIRRERIGEEAEEIEKKRVGKTQEIKKF